ncbi:HEPN domain-containing protein [Kribbella sp. NPDC049227]|uniref:HEPN domain-containing protein n=1 Tax=Kribbella sp. NPDC049227 TaxID=3364113 RepID=UPI003716A94D
MEGVFWVAETPEHRVRGRLDFDEGSVDLFDDELVSWLVTTQHDGYREMTPRLDNNIEYVIFGELDDGTEVSIHDGIRVPGRQEQGSVQCFRFLCGLRGGHVALDEQYVGAAVKFAGAWNRYIGNASWIGALNIPRFGDIEIAFNDGATFANVPNLSQLQVERFIIGPMRLLLSLLAGKRVDPIEILLVTAEGQAVSLLRPGPVVRQGTSPIVSLRFGLSGLQKWYLAIDKLTPVAAVVVKAITDSTLDVETRTFLLAASLEAIHRELHNELRMTAKEAQAIRRAAVAGVPDEAKDVVRMLLLGMEKLTFDERLQLSLGRLEPLTDDLAGSEVIEPEGGRQRWVQSVKAARNGVAHMKRTSPEDLRLFASQNYVLYESLRWVVTALLLSEVGVGVGDITAHFRVQSAYHLFRERAVVYLPEVYAVDGDAAQP